MTISNVQFLRNHTDLLPYTSNQRIKWPIKEKESLSNFRFRELVKFFFLPTLLFRWYAVAVIQKLGLSRNFKLSIAIMRSQLNVTFSLIGQRRLNVTEK